MGSQDTEATGKRAAILFAADAPTSCGSRPLAGAILLAIFFLCLFAYGCGVHMQSLKSGKKFPYDNVVLVKQGMHERDVLSLLGPPYGTGVSKDGNVFYRYSWSEVGIRSVYGGLLVVGESKRMELTGGEIELELDPASRLVKKFEYTIYGPENYDRLRRGRHD